MIRDARTILALATPPGQTPLKPTPEQAAIVEAPPLPMLVVAGAGAGKTATMSMRVLYLVASLGIDPEAILGLTFSRKAAGELGSKMRADLERLVINGGLDIQGAPVASTYNAFAQRIVLEHGMRIGLDPDLRLIGRARAVDLMTEIVTTWTGTLPESATVNTLVTNALDMAGHLAEHGLSIDRARLELSELHQDLAAISPKPTGDLASALIANEKRLAMMDLVEAFAARKRSEGIIDFADQLALATQIVHAAPDVVDILRAEHQAVLLDEFQDTSVVQMDLLSTIFHDHPVTAVGDPNQAIYGWRGASASSLESFLQRFHTQGEPAASQTRELSTAWRNDRRILVAANAVASPLRAHSTRAKSPVLQPRGNADVGEVAIAFDKDRARQFAEVARFIAQRRHRTRDGWSSAAVLCRRRRDIADADIALRELGIPTHIVGLGGLLDQPAVSDVRAALELAVDVGASPWLMRLLAAQDIGSADVVALHKWASRLAKERHIGPGRPDVYLIDAIDQPPAPGWTPPGGGQAFSAAAHERVSILGARLRAVREGLGRSISEQVERAIAILGVTEDLLADPLLNTGREALDAFVDVALNYEAEVPGASMRGFLAWLATAEAEEDGLPVPSGEPKPGAVHLLTIHASKGLEWDTVAVVAMGDSVFPKHDSASVPYDAEPVSRKGWLTRANALPTPLRGDSVDLPALVEDLPDGSHYSEVFAELYAEAAQVNRRATPSSVFNKYLKEVTFPAFGAHAEREERRLAYVALTRARHHLLLAGSWKDFAAKLKEPSRYLMEARRELLAMFRAPNHTWAAAVGDIAPNERADLIAALEGAIVERPEEDTDQSTDDDEMSAYFPPDGGPSRQRVLASAQRLHDLIATMGPQVDVPAALADVGRVVDEKGDAAARQLVADTQALMDERRLRAEDGSDYDIPLERLSATKVSALMRNPASFAQNLRRPVPTAPSGDSTLGTLFHGWIERELRMASGQLWDEEVPGVDSLTAADQCKLGRMQENFRNLDLLESHTPIAVEEPFSVEVGGLFLQGRIDAVLRDQAGRDTVIDWKSGRPIGPGSELATVEYFLTQLRLYRHAWAARTGVDECDVDAKVAFLAVPLILDIAELEALAAQLGASPTRLDQAVRQALDAVSA